jgi:hypothetical protein
MGFDQGSGPHRQRLQDCLRLAAAKLIQIVAFHLLKHDLRLGPVAILAEIDIARDRVKRMYVVNVWSSVPAPLIASPTTWGYA